MAKQSKIAPNIPANLGLYYNKTPLTTPVKAIQDGRNFRIRQGYISNLNLGWARFSRSLGTSDANTVVMLHFDGADAATRIVDGAGGPPYRAWAVAGNAQLDTAQFRFGTASLLCDGTGDWVTTASATALNLGAQDFTIDMVLRPAADGTQIYCAGRALSGLAAADVAWFIERQANNTVRFTWSDGSSLNTLTSTSTVLAGSWSHIAVERFGSTISLAVRGTVEATSAISGSINTVVAALRVGAAGEHTTTPWNGWIDEFHMSIGAATYDGEDYIVPTAPYTPRLRGAVMMIENFQTRDNPEVMVIASQNDIYVYDEETDTFRFITPQYNTATVDVSAANPAVVTPDTGTPNWVTNGIKPGDQILFGLNSSGALDEQWYEIDSVDGEGQLTLTTAVTGAALNNVSYTIRRSFTGSLMDQWDSDIFVAPNDGTGDDMLFMTNGVEPVVTWTIPSTYATYRTSLGFTAKQLRIFKSMMIYGNLNIGGDNFPTTFINSDAGIPLDVTNGLASEFRAHDGVDQIHELEDLGDNLVIYSERHLTLVQFVGDPLIFIFRQAATGLGPLGPRLVADFGDYHEFVGADSAYLFDGVSVTETGTQVWREILRARDASRQLIGFIHFDEENGDLLWVIPLASDAGNGDTTQSADEAIVEHYLEIEQEQIPDPFSRRDMPFTCGGYSATRDVLTWDEVIGTWEEQTIKWDDSLLSAAFPTNLMGATNGLIYTINTAQRADGEIMPSWVRFGRRPLTSTRDRGLLRRIYPYATQIVGNLDVVTRYSEHPDGQITDTQVDPFDLSLPQEGHFVAPYKRARYFEVEFRRDDGDPWELEGYDAETYQGGTR